MKKRTIGLACAAALVAGTVTASAATPTTASGGRSNAPRISIDDATAFENDGSISFDVTLDRPSDRRVTALFFTRSGSARANHDFEWTIRRVRIPAGETTATFEVPLIDDVQAEGLTPQELKEVITNELSEFVTAPDVTVLVLEMRSRFVSVLGEVGQISRVPLSRDLRVLEAIALVGGFSTFADKSNVRIVRRQPDGGEVEYRFDYGAYIRGAAPGTNIVLRPGGTIIVPD